MSKPIAVLISDIHFNIHTLELAAASLLKAQFKANLLDVPLVIAGDLLDTKAIIRAEVANKLVQMLSVKDAPDTIIMVGNHDLINEKGKEHALNFLKPYATIIDCPQEGSLKGTRVLMIPYQSDPQVIINILSDEEYPSPPLVIMHQGVQGSLMGDYVVDKSALPKEVFENYRVISGHYHPRQDIRCGKKAYVIKSDIGSVITYKPFLPKDIGLFSYIGNPYTLGFGEANDPEKGYQILNQDGTLDFAPTNLRKHVIYDLTIKDLNNGIVRHKIEDLVWLKIRGPKEELDKLEFSQTAGMFGTSKVDLIPTDKEVQPSDDADSFTQAELLDFLIDDSAFSSEAKIRLKDLWRKCASN